LLFRRKLKFNFELIPYEATGLSVKKITNFFLAGLNQYVLPSRPIGYPVIAQIEPTNFCNLSCPLCLTASQTNSRPRTVLPFATFKKLLDDMGDYLLLIILWNWGEPFLNPDIFKMIAYAKSKNIIVHSSTNGNVVLDDADANALVESGLDSLVVAMDGASQKTYSAYRQGGELQRVLLNIRSIVKAKQNRKSATPRIIVRFVAMKHNETEMHQVKKLALESSADFFSVKTVDMPQVLGGKLEEAYLPKHTEYRRYEYDPVTTKRRKRPFECMRPWKRVTVDARGDIIPCEYDYKATHSFGNVNTAKSVISAWKSETARAFRQKFNLGNNDSYLCIDCTYKNRVADDCTVEKFCLKQAEPSILTAKDTCITG
jgi:radical SAM protein with 4Fe4S-binding SPASM domain